MFSSIDSEWTAKAAVSVKLSIAILTGVMFFEPTYAQEPIQLDENCTVTVGNQTAIVRPDGSFFVNNIPVFQSRETGLAPQLYRARATCLRGGEQISGQSEFFELIPGQTVFVADIFPTELDPIPIRIELISPAKVAFLGNTVQLRVMAHFVDGPSEDVTARSQGTTYLSANPKLLTVDEDGLVTGQNATREPQTGSIAVLHQGNVTTINLIAFGGSDDFDNDGMPNDYEVLFGLDRFVDDANEDLDNDGATNLEEFQRGSIPTNPDTDEDGLLDGQDGDPLHPEEGPPTVVILSPGDGNTVVEGQTVNFSINATDDGLLTKVVLETSTGISSTLSSPPFQTNIVMATGIEEIILKATAFDSVGNQSVDTAILSVIPDPLSTIVGRVIDLDGGIIEGAEVTIVGSSVTERTDLDGNFQLLDIPTVQRDFRIRVAAEGIVAVSERFTFVLGGITDIGVIQLRRGPQSSGFEFLLAFQPNTQTPLLTLFISSEDINSGLVEIPGIGFSKPFTVVPGIVTEMVIPSDAVVTVSDEVENLGVHVTAQAPINVYGLNQVPFTSDAFSAYPVAAFGRRYRVMSYVGLRAAQFAVVASEDNTVLTISPRRSGMSFEVNLNAFEVYQGTGNDVTGTLITASKPVGVFSGNQCTEVPIDVPACDHLVEQMPPTDTWGRSIITVPLATRLHGDTFRILADEDDTLVDIMGVSAESLVLNAGEFAERILLGNNQITATKPILVAQFSNGGLFDDTTSDPFMMLVPPAERFIRNYTFATPGSGFPENFVNIVADTSDVQAGNVILDGFPLDSSLFAEVSATSFSVASIRIPLGSHTVTSDKPCGIYVYGFADSGSYGYPGGLGLLER